jgi:WD40 repeat protein
MLDLGMNSSPALGDIDGDSDMDLVVGTGGIFQPPSNGAQEGTYTSKLAYYENTGTSTSPIFTFRTNDLAGLSSLNEPSLNPALADLNGDGKADLCLGLANGTFLFYKQNGNAIWSSMNWGPLCDAGDVSYPEFFDINNDQKKDLISGNKQGYFKVFLNTGSITNPIFNSVAEPTLLNSAETIEEANSNFGYSAPRVCRYLNKNYLFSGSERGTLFLWEILNNNNLELKDSMLNAIDEGRFISPSVYQATQNDLPNLIVGNMCGGLTYYKGNLPSAAINIKSQSGAAAYPNPGNEELNLKAQNPISQVHITSVDGKTILSQAISNSQELTLSTGLWPSGVYLIALSTSQGTDFFKWIKTSD